MVGFDGARGIEQTISETRGEGFQRAEYLLEHGIVDMVVHRSELRDTLIRVLSLLLNKEPAATVLPMLDADGGAAARNPAQNPPATPPDNPGKGGKPPAG